MDTSHFAYEEYFLYSLGSLEEEQREALSLHLRDQCSICLEQVRQSVEFWCMFGLHITSLNQPITRPSPALRNRILRSVRPAAKDYILPPVWTWSRAAAGAFVMIGVSTVSWYAGNKLHEANSSGPILVPNVTTPVVTPNQSTTEAPPVDSHPQTAARSSQPEPAAPTVNTELTDKLTAQIQTLTEQNAKLEAELEQNRNQVARVSKERDDMASSQTRTIEDVQRRTADLERTRETLMGRVRELEQLTVEYRQTIEIQRQQLKQETVLTAALNTPNVKLVKLDATTAGQGSTGHALLANGSLLFYASNLPAAQPGRTYQLWVIRGKSPAIVSAGTFNNVTRGGPAVRMNNPGMLGDVKALAVTEEPAGGSALPTGHKILIGAARS